MGKIPQRYAAVLRSNQLNIDLKPTPLYIDLHIDNSLTPDLIRQCHVADKSVQERYGVRYLQILLNQPQGYLFCLVEGPDKEACAKVHQEAHGNIACNILEITESDFSALLARKQKDGHDFTLNTDGTLDTGNRAILSVDILGAAEHHRDANQLAGDMIRQYNGYTAATRENRLLAFFDSCESAVRAALAIGEKISESALAVEARMGVDIGPPLKEKGSLFEDVFKSAGNLSFLSRSGQVTISTNVMHVCKDIGKHSGAALKVLSPADEKFLGQVMTCIENTWDNGDLTIEDFGRELGMSKSQLGRKLKSLTGSSPNEFIKEFRLRSALHLMEHQSMNVAEVTMAIGFTNPSYFSKCFRKRFGKVPSDYKVA